MRTEKHDAPQLAHNFSHASGGDIIKAGPFLLDTENDEAWLHKEQMNLTNGPLRLLFLLAQHPNRMLSDKFILKELYPEGDKNNINIRVSIGRIRAASKEAGGTGKEVVTLNKVGYMIPDETARSALPHFQCGALDLYPDSYEVFFNGTPLHLRLTQFQFLLQLIRTPERYKSKAILWQAVQQHYLPQIVTDLRRVLIRAGATGKEIEQKEDRGYRLVDTSADLSIR